MTLANWSILAAIVLPYFLALLGQMPGLTYEGFKAPRARWGSLTGWKQRANSAHLNGFEGLPGFAAAVIIAQLAKAPQDAVDLLALTYIATRILHAGFYIGNLAIARTIVWASGLACVVALFFIAA